MIGVLSILFVAGLLGASIVARTRASDAGPAGESGLRAGTALALALGIASTATTASFLVPAGATRSAVIGAIVLIAAAFAAPWPRAGGPRLPSSPAPAPAPRVLLALLAVVGLAAVYVVVARLVRRPDGEWDAFAFWNLRARLLHRGGADPSILFAPEMPGSHPDYPLFLSGLVAAGWSLSGEGVTWVTGAIATLLGALAAGGLFAAVSPRRGGTVAAFAVLVYLASPHVLREVAWRYADIPLSAFLVLACGWLASATEHPKQATSALALAGLCASLGAWTKNEGAVHVLALALVTVARPPAGLGRLRALRAYAKGAWPFLLVLVAFKAGFAPPNDLVAGTDDAGALARLADPSRYAEIARHLGEELVRFSHWSYLLPAVVLVAALGPRRDGGARPLGLALGLVALGYFAVYLLTFQPLVWHLRHSLDRLLLQLFPATLLVASLRLRGELRA